MSKPAATEPAATLPRWVPTRAKAAQIVFWYAALGVLWIYGSGWLLHRLVQDGVLLEKLETIKGCGFVAVTSFLLLLMLSRNFRAIRRAATQLQESERQLRLIGDNLPDSYVYQFAPGRTASRASPT